MNNVVPLFTDRQSATPMTGNAPVESQSAAQQGARARWIRPLKFAVFLVLYWLRLPVLLVCRLIYLPCLAALLIGLVVARDHTLMLTVLGSISLAAFVAQWAYDLVLASLAPYDVVQQL